MAVLPGESQRPERPAGRRERKHQTPRANEAVARPGPEPGEGAQEVVGQHLRDSYRGEEDINKGEVGKEKIHGVVKVNVRVNGQDDEQVSNQCDGVNEQEKDEEEVFLFLMTTNS